MKKFLFSFLTAFPLYAIAVTPDLLSDQIHAQAIIVAHEANVITDSIPLEPLLWDSSETTITSPSLKSDSIRILMLENVYLRDACLGVYFSASSAKYLFDKRLKTDDSDKFNVWYKFVLAIKKLQTAIRYCNRSNPAIDKLLTDSFKLEQLLRDYHHGACADLFTH